LGTRRHNRALFDWSICFFSMAVLLFGIVIGGIEFICWICVHRSLGLMNPFWK